jgi:hypothetical protein
MVSRDGRKAAYYIDASIAKREDSRLTPNRPFSGFSLHRKIIEGLCFTGLQRSLDLLTTVYGSERSGAHV